MTLKTFFCELVDPMTRRLWLRRYHSEPWDSKLNKSPECCPGKWGYHNAGKFLRDETFEWEYDTDERCSLEHRKRYPSTIEEAKTIPEDQWPTKCEFCPYVFTDKDSKQIMQDLLYRRIDTGELYSARDLPPGATYYDPFNGTYFGGTGKTIPGPDGKWLIAICPNGRHWCIDSRANNCTMPNDTQHKCWVRHGDPRLANITVDKQGKTCAAGAGSIQAGDYHGFLRNGSFT